MTTDPQALHLGPSKSHLPKEDSRFVQGMELASGHIAGLFRDSPKG